MNTEVAMHFHSPFPCFFFVIEKDFCLGGDENLFQMDLK